MSDSEDDSGILDEIRALEDVLAKDDSSTTSNVCKDVSKYNLASRRTIIPSRGFGEVTPRREAEAVVNEIVYPHTAYETNKQLIELLQDSKRELLAILEKCIENKSIVEEKIRIAANNTKSVKIYIASAGMPYFKDAKHFFAPRNKDTITKSQNDELQVVQHQLACPWTPKDRNTLWMAIRQEAAAAVLEKERLSDSQPSSPRNNDTRQKSCRLKVKALNLPKNFKAMIGPLDSREFDWLKIAATDFENRHTPEECRVMWRVFLHPDINRYRWTKDEDEKIDKLSQRYKQQDWESIAEELGTQRSGYQCFIRYNTNNRTTCLNERPWSEEEDTRLLECMNKLKIGHYIPWGNVARYMDGRSKNQVYFRWKYNAAPHLKKGRFTPEEDSTLIDAVAKWGQHFSRISEQVMPNRSTVQLSDHYQTLVQREHGVRNSWSVSDDATVLKLYSKYGPDWSNIALEFPGKTRTQIRHRHKAILRYWDKGISLYDIQRKYGNDTSRAVDTRMIDGLQRKKDRQHAAIYCTEAQKIDSELMNFFQLIPPVSKPGRKQKYYREEELQNTTRNLDILLKTLDVNLAIPEDLDNRNLTEKDKQLLESLKDYQQLQLEYAKAPSTAVEHARMKLFGPETDENNWERHFRPLCSGNCNHKRKEKVRSHDSIDYRYTEDFDNCQIKLDMEFDTPTIISNLVGEETNAIFNKLMRSFQLRETETSCRNIVEKIYVLRPQKCSTILSTVETLPHASQSFDSIQQTTSTRTNRNERGTGRVESWDSCIWNGIIHQQDQVGNCVEPSYYTLLGLQHFLSKQKIAPNSAFFESDQPANNKGLRSLEILKKRLVQLFKYPIGLSNIVRPEIYIENVQCNTFFDDGTNAIEESVDDFPDVSPTKRRRLTDKGEESICRKNQRGGESGSS